MSQSASGSYIGINAPFKARQVNPSVLYGSKPLGLPQQIRRPTTKFKEFKLSHSKHKKKRSILNKRDRTQKVKESNKDSASYLSLSEVSGLSKRFKQGKDSVAKKILFETEEERRELDKHAANVAEMVLREN